MEKTFDSELVEKYDVPTPRYTSYPPVPFWQSESITPSIWIRELIKNYNPDEGLSLYIHLPFCESLCTYCGCNKRITKNHDVEAPYISAIIAEWNQYLKILPDRPKIRQIHLGGGTPTFFRPSELFRLIKHIKDTSRIAINHEFSLEVHPSSTQLDHLITLRKLGFRRISVGVQDVSPEILKIINRKQAVGEVRKVIKWARKLGYTSVNVDLIYGLPKQNEEHIRKTIQTILEIRPERLAFYSYAHVPWKSASQRAYTESDLPQGIEKSKLYTLGRNLLLNGGYRAVGMDHFCLREDDLYKSYEKKKMHRNFMGYCTHSTTCMIGLGASSISDSWSSYIQNIKSVEDYVQAIQQNKLPILKGHLLTAQERYFRRVILDLMCKDQAEYTAKESMINTQYLGEFCKDNLVELNESSINIIGDGKSFVRNICAAIDPIYSIRSVEDKPIFSKAI